MYDTGSTAFMIVCTMLVLLMTPGLAFFYGGLSRRKNVINTMIMVMSIIGLVGVMWIVCGAIVGENRNGRIGDRVVIPDTLFKALLARKEYD